MYVRRIIPEVDQSTKRRFSLASEIVCARSRIDVIDEC